MAGFKINKAKDVEQEKDVVGGGGAWESNLYPLEIINAYLHTSDEGAQALMLEVKDENGRSQKQSHYVTTKTGDCFYTDGKDKKHYLPGYLIANALAMLASEGEAEITDLDTEDRIIKVWDSSKGAEVNKKVPVFYDLIGLEFVGGIIKITKPKSSKGADGKYVDDPKETIDVNEMDKVFNTDGFTTLELLNGADEPLFQEKWLARWEGKTKVIKPKDAAKGRPAGGAKTATSRTPAAGGAKKSFFKK